MFKKQKEIIKQNTKASDNLSGPGKPKTCLLTVTNRCILRCKMCNLWKLDTSENEISIEECKRFIDSLNKFTSEPVEVHLIGGEALIKNGILDLVKFIKEKGARTVITSSGYTIDELTARAIVDSGLSHLNLSLESLNPSTHDFLRGRDGCFQQLMAALGYFNKVGKREMKLGINSIISGVNLEDILKLTEWVEQEKSLDSIYFMAVMRPFGSNLGWDWYKKEDYKFLWPENLEKLNLVIDKLIYFKKAGYKIENSITQFKIFKKYFENPEDFIKSQRCNLPDRAINVNAIGDMYICFFMDKLGNIKTDDISERWFSKEANRIRNQMSVCKKNCELVINCYYEEEE